MKYGIITTGSRGDVQPFVALALAMKERGHEVTLVAPENFSEWIKGFGIPFSPVYGDVEKIIQSPEAIRLLRGGNVFRFFYHLQKISAETADRSNQDILQACADFDGLITSVLPLPVVFSIAEKYQKKCAAVFLSMPPIPTKEFPFQAFGTKSWGIFNRLSYKFLALSYSMIRRKMDQFRISIGLAPKNVLKACLQSGMLAITTMSTTLLKKPEDWPVNAHQTGFFYLPASTRTGAGAEGLEEWLAQGPAPVYVGFGSIPVPDPQRLYDALREVLKQHRIVFCTGWSVLEHLPEHPNLFVTQYANHDWLLPRCQAAVIHGGIGTVGAVLRSGIPVVIVSVLADQPVNGKLIEQKKIGFHIPFKELSPVRLLRALDAVQDQELRARCVAVAAVIREEDGIGNAVQLIEGYFNDGLNYGPTDLAFR